MAEIPVKSEVAGVVAQILVSPRDEVTADSEIVIVEAMKMELPVLASAAGTVRAVLVEVGDNVGEGQTVAILAVS